jgi:hypothetical protein
MWQVQKMGIGFGNTKAERTACTKKDTEFGSKQDKF